MKKIVFFIILLQVSVLWGIELGTVRMALPSEINQLYPGKLSSYSERSLFIHVYETLVSYKDKQIKPVLIKKWEHEDHKKYIFEIDTSIKFHDNSYLTPEDIKQSLLAIDTSIQYNKVFANINFVEIDEDKNVIIRLNDSDENFIYYLSLIQAGIWKKSSDWPYPLGTGPFYLEEKINDRVVLVSHKGYREKRRIKRIEFIFKKTKNDSVINLFYNGDIHIGPLSVEDYLKVVSKSPDHSIIEKYKTKNIVALRMNRTHPFFKKRSVYYGIQAALGREAFKVLLAGQLNEQIGWHPYSSEHMILKHQNNRAQRHLKNISIPPAICIRHISVFGGEALIFNKVASYFERAGFQRIKTKEVAEYDLQMKIKKGSYELLGEIIYADIDLASYYDKCEKNFFIKKKKRKTFFPLYAPFLNIIYKKGLKGFTVYPNGVIDFNKAYWEKIAQ